MPAISGSLLLSLPSLSCLLLIPIKVATEPSFHLAKAVADLTSLVVSIAVLHYLPNHIACRPNPTAGCTVELLAAYYCHYNKHAVLVPDYCVCPMCIIHADHSHAPKTQVGADLQECSTGDAEWHHPWRAPPACALCSCLPPATSLPSSWGVRECIHPAGCVLYCQ